MPTETMEPRFGWAMTFLAITECGSFTRAADQLGCSKASVSKQVLMLEKALGVKLLHRTTRQITPTESGAVYMEYCKRLRDMLQDAERTVQSMRTEARGRIRMSVSTSFGVEFMYAMLVALHEKHPDIEVDLDLSTEPRDLINDGFDLALRFSRALDPRLIAKPLWVSHDWVLASPELLAERGLPGDPRELEHLPCLCNSHFEGEDLWLFSLEHQLEVVRVKHWLRMNNYPLMRRAAINGLGFAKLPAYLVADDVEQGRLQRVFPEYKLPATPLYLVFPDQRPLPHKVRVTLDHIAGWFSRDSQNWIAGTD